MPSDAKKKKDARKKELAKAKVRPKKQGGGDDEESQTGGSQTGDSTRNNSPTPSQNGFDKEDGDMTNGVTNGVSNGHTKEITADEDIARQMAQVELENADARACTGVLASHPQARDIKINNLSCTFHGWELVVDTTLELNVGRKYGFIGANGSGKSSILQSIARREFPIPEGIDIFLLSREMPATDKTALQAVIEVDQERHHLEAEAEELAHNDDPDAHEKLMDIYDRLDEISADTAEARAAELLFGLGFSPLMMKKKCRDFSGGWRMRIALARALFLKPEILLLDEPTNHLDLDACVWLEEELKEYKRILVVVSHSQDFLNGVCTNIIHLNKQKLDYYGGNYDAFMKTRLELMENQMKRYKWEQDQIAHMKDYVARFGHGSAKLARQAQSKEKTMAKMIAGGLTEKVTAENTKQFYFFDPGHIPPPVIMVQNVSFRYNEDSPYIYKNLDFGIDMDTRLALVGPNGAGKTTLLKLLSGDVQPSDGIIRRHSHVKMGRYHQHLHEQLDLELSALDYMMACYPHVKDVEVMRKIVGRYGLTGRQQVCPMKQLSDGQRCRVSFAWLAYQSPHLLLLDEPTNHLDMESIDSLAEAINNFEGAMILVSHDFRLVQQVAEVIWVCDHQKITKWEGDIFTFKEKLRKQIERRRAKAAAM